jgi:hypothetical protein
MNNLEQIREQIRQQLNLCDEFDTPQVCAMKETSEGYQEVEKLILQKVMYGSDISIADAIVEIENEYNPNALE